MGERCRLLGWLAFMKKYYPDGDLTDFNNAYGYSSAQTMVDVLKRAATTCRGRTSWPRRTAWT